jgi:hypothetical protein
VLGLTGVAAATGSLPVGSEGRAVVATEADDTTSSTAIDDSTTSSEPTTTESTTTEPTTTESTTTEPTTAPTPTEVPTTAPESDDEGGRGPDATGPARHGLCTAFGARTEVPEGSVAARNLVAAASAAGQTTAEFCAGVTAPGRSGSTPGAAAGSGPSSSTPAPKGPPAGKGKPADPGAAGRAHKDR